MNKIKFNFIIPEVNIPTIEITFEGNRKFYAFIDTGAEETMFNLDFILSNKDLFDIEKFDKDMSICGISYDKSKVNIMKIKSEIQLKDESGTLVKYDIKGSSIPMTNIEDYLTSVNSDKKIVAIIGSDFLFKNNAEIDYEHQTILLSNVIHRK